MKKINCKFQVGDTAWLMHENKVCCGKVEKVNIEQNRKDTKIVYNIHIRDGVRKPPISLYHSESVCFETKESLIKSL